LPSAFVKKKKRTERSALHQLVDGPDALMNTTEAEFWQLRLVKKIVKEVRDVVSVN